FVPGRPWYLCHVAASIRRRRLPREIRGIPLTQTDHTYLSGSVGRGPRRQAVFAVRRPPGGIFKDLGVPPWPQDLALRGGFLPDPGRKFALLNPFGPEVNLEYRTF